MFLQFAVWGAWFVVLGVYLEKGLGFTGTQIGSIYGTMALGGIFAPMKKPLILIACLLLAGCTDADWNHALNYSGMGDAEPDAAPPAPTRQVSAPAAPQPVAAAPMAPANNDFCKGVATNDATANSFDPATQQRVLQQSYAQCLTIYSR